MCNLTPNVLSIKKGKRNEHVARMEVLTKREDDLSEKHSQCENHLHQQEKDPEIFAGHQRDWREQAVRELQSFELDAIRALSPQEARRRIYRTTVESTAKQAGSSRGQGRI